VEDVLPSGQPSVAAPYDPAVIGDVYPLAYERLLAAYLM